MDHVYLALAWCGYFFLHSWMASTGVKQCVHRLWPRLAATYRLVYVTIATTGLAGMIWLQAATPNRFNFIPPLAMLVAGAIFVVAGAATIALSFRQYSLAGFVGLRNDEQDNLCTTGILRYVRHPIYSGTILLSTGFLAIVPTSPVVISVVCILTYLPIGIHFEEKKLVNRYGKAYQEYRNKVPGVFPKLSR